MINEIIRDTIDLPHDPGEILTLLDDIFIRRSLPHLKPLYRFLPLGNNGGLPFMGITILVPDGM